MNKDNEGKNQEGSDDDGDYIEDFFLNYHATGLDDCIKKYIDWSNKLEMLGSTLENYYIGMVVGKCGRLEVNCDLYGVDTRLGLIEKFLES